MGPQLRSLFAEALKASPRTKAVALLCALCVAALVGAAGMVANRPHFVTLYSGLDDAERVAVEKALAEGGVRFRVSQPPGPYAVYVDESGYDRAQIAVALAEALKRAPTGINASETGAGSIFLSSGERLQNMLKREWQETEHLLQQLEFVSRATVTTSTPDSSPLGPKKPLTVSVALKLRGAGALSREQAENVAKLVRFRFGVPAENVLISDQSGRALYDPSAAEGELEGGRNLFEHAAGYDRELARKANDLLEETFGARKARVTVTSEWDHEQSTTVAETIDPETVALSTHKTKSESPQGPGSAGGPAGTASNLGFGVENAAVPSSPAAGGAGLASTSEEKTVYEAGRSRTQSVRTAPRLERLYVSLVIDESLAPKRAEIEKLVQAAVGFDEGRNDVLGISSTTFAEPAAGESEGAQGAGEGGGGTLEMLLERGVEIVAAIGFLVLFFTSLKGGKKRLQETSAGAEERAAGEPDPELVARAQIEELVKSDPRKVGEILSRWAGEESPARAGR